MVRSRRGKTRRVDFSQVETFKALPDGKYLVKIDDVEIKEGDKGEYFNWVLKVTKGKNKGKKLWVITSLVPESLWNLKNFLDALGADYPESAFDVDPTDYVDMELGVTVEVEEFEGKDKNRVTDYWPADDAEEEEDDEEPSRRSITRRSKSENTDEDEESSSKKRRARDEDEEEEKPRKKAKHSQAEDDEEEEEGDERPTKKGKKNSKLSRDDFRTMEEEELETLVNDYELDVDLDEYKTVGIKRKAVMAAMVKAKHVSD